MFFGMGGPQTDYAVFAQRRKNLMNQIQSQGRANSGALLLLASLENNQTRFRQDSSFYYLTGITDPAIAFLMEGDGTTTLFIPNYAQNRSAWHSDGMSSQIQEYQSILGIDHIVELGSVVQGFTMGLWEESDCYENLSEHLGRIVSKGGTIFTLSPSTPSGYVDQRILLGRFAAWINGFAESAIDVSQLVNRMRRKKDYVELEQLGRAIDITCYAQSAAASNISVNISECELQAHAEYLITALDAQIAFPTIAASGANGTVLHSSPSPRIMEIDELVVVDCGAESGHYCGDISRTYPISGMFSDRQRDLYSIVLDVQTYLAENVKPGYCISNVDDPAKSMNHIARELLRKKGYENYLHHGVSHYLGLDVHDVGLATEPLQEGDIITIEPGLYLPDEQIGIRIEDNYWVTKNGLICLSEALPKRPEEVEALMRGEISVNQQIDEQNSEEEPLH